MLFVIKNNKTITNKSLVIKFLEIFLSLGSFPGSCTTKFWFWNDLNYHHKNFTSFRLSVHHYSQKSGFTLLPLSLQSVQYLLSLQTVDVPPL